MPKKTIKPRCCLPSKPDNDFTLDKFRLAQALNDVIEFFTSILVQNYSGAAAFSIWHRPPIRDSSKDSPAQFTVLETERLKSLGSDADACT